MEQDTRQWLVRKKMAGARGRTSAFPFDSRQASVIGPDTEPIWLMPVAEHERQMEVAFGADKEKTDA